MLLKVKMMENVTMSELHNNAENSFRVINKALTENHKSVFLM